MQLTVSANKESVEDRTGGMSFINTEGIFDIVLNFASISDTKNGAKSLNLNITYNGNKQTIYGPTIQNRDGNQNDVGMSLINKLSVIVGLGDGDVLETDMETHEVGKDNKPQEFKVITNFSEMPCKIRTQREYSKWDGKIQERLQIRNVFREDGATAAEILAGGEIGKQMALELEKHCDTPYLNGVTQEEVDAFLANRSKGGNKGAAKAATTGNIVDQKAALFS